jgi:2,4-diketo-3-deoxy-L-fuconate hydrolase
MKLAGYLDGNEVMIGAELQKKPAIAPGKTVGKLASLEQRPAVPETARVICIGLNYRLHAQEAKAEIPTVPVVFGRWPNTLTCDGDPAPAVDEKFDWEAELGVVIGRELFRVSEEQAAAGVFGYVAFNDLSARHYQLQTPQWTFGKNTEASGPMTPIVTKDEVGDPASPGLRIRTWVNGDIMQDSVTSDMIFHVPALIAHLSQALRLNPGDLIVTGTPQGVGIARGRFLKPGDVVEVEVERVGRIRTPIVGMPPPVS